MTTFIVLLYVSVTSFYLGRMSTEIWRTWLQNFREEYIDYHARQREAPTFEVSYDWRKNQEQTRYH